MKKRIVFISVLFHLAVFCFGQIDFEREVLPILQERCLECHKAPYEQNGRLKEPKAGLRLDGAFYILRGSEDGKVVAPNHPSDSLLYKLINLPADDDDRMPPKGELLTKAQREIIRKWIAQGVDFGKWEGATDGVDDLAKLDKRSKPKGYVPSHLAVYDELAHGLKPLSDETLLAVSRETGAMVRPIGVGSPLLEVRFLAESVDSGDPELNRLAPLADHLTKLDLRNTQVTSEGIHFIASLERLSLLNLRGSEVVDANLEMLSKLDNLVSLNLTETEVGDAGLRKLGGCKSLRRLYLWNSKATGFGVQTLRKKLKGLEVSM